MSQQLYQAQPTYDQPLTIKGQTATVWYRFFSALYQGQPSAAEVALAVGISPFSYLAPTRGNVLINGGTVSAVQITRSLTTLTGLTSGFFPLSNGDTLTVTYSGLPTMTWYPS